MEKNPPSIRQQALCNDVELGKEKNLQSRSYQRGALILGLVFLVLALCIFGLRYIWNPSPAKVYDHDYKAMLDGVEIDSMMEIDPAKRLEIFRVGKGSDEVLEVHDFQNGLTGIRFAKHHRCYIRTQTKELPKLDELQMKEAELEVGQNGEVDVQVVDSHVWIPAEWPITDTTFLLNSKIWEMCTELPIHWIHPSPLKEAEFHDMEDVEDMEDIADTPETHARGARQTRDVMDQLPVNDYTEIGLQLDSTLDEQGYCCQYCHRGYRFCRRYHEPLLGYWPYPYWYQGGRVICQIVMPCNWWIARMLGRV
ncbi:tenomodulin [Electrophorus electricus]|uniref:tenomodulin n=1 Tax=Electrophorus electricus TaxID=8005 RepID=UPI0015D01E05|nr:tenomodulin [Electrophorus electricus]